MEDEQEGGNRTMYKITPYSYQHFNMIFLPSTKKGKPMRLVAKCSKATIHLEIHTHALIWLI